MRSTMILAAVAALAVTLPMPAFAQAPAPLQIAASAEVQALIANAKKTIKPGQTNLVQKVVGVAPFNANLEYRTGWAAAALHEKEDEMFLVVEGSGAFVIGGRLLPAPGVNAMNPNVPNTTIEGGVTHQIAKGDFMIVPHGAPHQVTAVNGALAMISMHLPRP